MTTGPTESLLLVANYDSNAGYAWWLMESFWAFLAHHFAGRYRTVLAYPSISVIPDAIADAPLEVVRANFRRRRWGDVRAQVAFIRARDVRVVYLTDGMVRDWRYAVWRAAGVQRIVVHDHTPGTRSVPRGLRRTAKQLLCRLPIVTADALIGATPFVRARHVESTCFPAARCHIAENGLPMRGAVDAVDVHARFAIPGDRHVAVVVGRADRIKGVEVAIDAVAQLVNRGRHDVHLLHVGDGPDLDRFRARAERLGVSAFVTFAGRQDGVPGILRGCAIAIHPSFAEVGYSLAILESMEAGLPVLVSDDPSVCGATEHGVTGLHVRTGDPTALATALAALLDDGGLRRRLGAAAAAQLQARFTLAHTHRQLGEAMDRIVDAPVRPSAAAA